MFPKKRRITDHMVQDDEPLLVLAIDPPTTAGSSHVYDIVDEAGNLSHTFLNFQDGPVHESGVGINGITNESLLAVVIDRLRGFQSGPFKCRENALALTKLEEAMQWLHARTRERIRRGVEGKNII